MFHNHNRNGAVFTFPSTHVIFPGLDEREPIEASAAEHSSKEHHLIILPSCFNDLNDSMILAYSNPVDTRMISTSQEAWAARC